MTDLNNLLTPMMLISFRPNNNAGYIELEPVNASDRNAVRASNQYDGTCIAYLYADTRDILADLLTEDDIDELDKGYSVQAAVDSWTFRHLVGGQND